MNTRLWRVGGVATVVALGSNTLLWPITHGDDTFVKVIAVADAIAALGLIVTHYVHRLVNWTGEALVLAMAAWIANVIEFAAEDRVPWQSRLRSCGFYSAFALLALGMFLVFHAAELDKKRTQP